MLKSLIGSLLVASVLLIGADKAKDQAWKPTPLMRTVAPDTAKAGDVLTISGEYLDKTRVKDIYLTDSKMEWKCEIVEQQQNEAKVKVPAKSKTGRLRLMILTTGVEPQFLEQPVAVEIQE